MNALEPNMINFQLEKGKFNYRVAGILMRDEKILITKYEHGAYWYLPGGRADLLEDSKTSLKREFKEELDCEIEIQQLHYLIEHFFTYKNIDYHEICLMYGVELIEGEIPNEDFVREEYGAQFFFKWVTMAELANYDIKPLFLKKGLTLKNEIQHLTQYDN